MKITVLKTYKDNKDLRVEDDEENLLELITESEAEEAKERHQKMVNYYQEIINEARK